MTGLKALTYFQVGTLIAMVFGLVAINVFRLGDGVHADVGHASRSARRPAVHRRPARTEWWEFLTHIVPESFFAPFVEGDILQIIFLAVLFGDRDQRGRPLGSRWSPGRSGSSRSSSRSSRFIMKAAPLGAFGAMAYAIGKFGLSTLTSLGSLIALFYVTSSLFVVVVLGGVLAAYVRLNIFQLFRYLGEFCSSWAPRPPSPRCRCLMRKLELPRRRPATVGLVVPTGYSFNLDGAAIYLSLAAVYLAQATDTPLTIGQQLGLLAVMLLTSKGAAGVAGGGFIALTATLAPSGPSRPPASC